MTQRQQRTAVRLIVVAENAILLLRYNRDRAAGGPFWVPPGGAVEAGETFDQAASRELCEETGLSAKIGSRLWDLHVEFKVEDVLVDQTETYFLVELAAKKTNLRNTTSEPIAAHRWWAFPELLSIDEVIYPEGLVEYLRANNIGSL
jgi:8-oxo-dGTP pyrophosphatase MutT (NUDIX family)